MKTSEAIQAAKQAAKQSHEVARLRNLCAAELERYGSRSSLYSSANRTAEQVRIKANAVAAGLDLSTWTGRE